MLVTGLLLWKTASVGQDCREYARNENPGLPGAALFRLPPVGAGTWRWLADNLRRFDTFVTMPGLNSLYFWTGKEPPSTCNATAWVSLFDDTTQSRIVANLGKYGHVGRVRGRERTAAWIGTQDVSVKPLGRFIEHQMKPIGERNGYEVMEAIPANPP